MLLESLDYENIMFHIPVKISVNLYRMHLQMNTKRRYNIRMKSK